MSKIILKQVYLLNWYGFIDKTIPVGKNLSLITGENECGKSTVLDAIKYAFTGDTDFNKATSATRVGSGRRTLSSYTRCLIDPDTRKYARPSSSHPNVYTHIALEYYNELYESAFVLGVILETNSSDQVDNYWYSLENRTLKDISFFDETAGKKYVLSAKQFRDRNRTELLNKNNGVVKFMTMTGLKLQSEGIIKYQRKLKNIMTYNPEAKIQQFIKESVLEDKKINLKKLKEAKDNIDDLHASFQILEKEINDLDAILGSFNNYARVDFRLKKDDAKRLYKDFLQAVQKMEANTKMIDDKTFEIERLTNILKKELSDKEQADMDLRSANRQLDQLDGTRALQDEIERRKELEAKATEYAERVNKLSMLAEKIHVFAKEMSLEDLLSDLTDPEIPSLKKKEELNAWSEKIDHLLDDLNKRIYMLDSSLEDIQSEMIKNDEVIKACDRNLPDYSKVPHQLGLIREINKKFEELKIDSKARFSSSFVIRLKNEEWRNTVETFLGIHRYSILVEPQYFHIANRVMDQSQYKYVELVNTKLLSRKHFKIEDDSVLHQLEIRNETALQYFSYWLGKIHAVDIEDVPNHESAVCKEGKISRNMAVSFLNFKKTDSYCLGEDAVQLNKERAIKQKSILEEQKHAFLEEKSILCRKLELTKRMNHLINQEHDLDAPYNHSMNQMEIYECDDKIRKLKEALKNNSEYMLLAERINDIETKLKQLNKTIEENQNRKITLKTQCQQLSRETEQLKNKKDVNEEKLEHLSAAFPIEVREAKNEYDLFVEGKRSIGDVMIAATRTRTENEKGRWERDITNQQSVYNTGKSREEMLPVGLEHEAIYRRRKNVLQIDNFEDIKTKLAVQTQKYEDIFKNEFILKMKTHIEEAQTDIKEINRQLKKLRFSTTYQFDVKTIAGASDYAKILDYADYLKKVNRIGDGQFMISLMDNYDENEADKREEEIKEIVNKIISKNNDELLNDFADYRNYMEYEVLVTNDEIVNGRLSKLAGYNSGAGTQIPYTIILSAALAIIYNSRQNSTRLVFIDEPFEKMSDKNIKAMLDFFKTQDFQVVFCAPPNKLDSIGKECDAVIPIKKINKSNMILGAIKFYEQI